MMQHPLIKTMQQQAASKWCPVSARVATAMLLLPTFVQLAASDDVTHSEDVDSETRQQVTQAKTNLNVLLIMADDVPADAIGVYGNTYFDTPRLDALATGDGGTHFRNAFSLPSCTPSRNKSK